MRRVARLAIVLTCGAAAAAAARAAEPSSGSNLSAPALAPPPGTPDDAIGTLLAKAAPLTDVPVDWRSGEVRFTPKTTLRLRVGDPLAAPGARALQEPGFAGPQSYELSVERDWPAAFSFGAGAFGVDVTPHAGLGFTTHGGMAEAGATLQLSQHVDQLVKDRLRAMGVRDGAKLGDQGRWYLFAAASGRSVGLNMLPGEAGWRRAGWTTDQTSTLVGDAQLGVGWRKGDMQTSLGFVHREIKGMPTLYGQDIPKADSMVAFSFSVRPAR